jgi:hypothetical protein
VLDLAGGGGAEEMGMNIGERAECLDRAKDLRPHVLAGERGAQAPRDGVVGGAREQPDQFSVAFE